MSTITSLADLEARYGTPSEAAVVKEAGRIGPAYRAMIQASPFVALATVGPEGLDCSPRGDAGSVVRVHDDRTLMLPDRAGNNRTDSLRNIVRDPRVALLFLIPGSGNTMRVNGRAVLSVDPDLLASFAMEGKEPRSVVVVTVDSVYFQCGRAVLRADLWNPERHVDPKDLPSAGTMLAEASDGRVGGPDYDKAWPARARRSLW
jgi:PPOX class probable FMN-dependent enzyme